jgi:hypothetical protein
MQVKTEVKNHLRTSRRICRTYETPSKDQSYESRSWKKEGGAS